MSNTNKTVLVTGCTLGGIGHALAEEFHARGCRVFATARRLEAMQVLTEMGITTLELDVTDITAIREVREKIALQTGGTLNVLINNAGQSYPVAITDMSMPDVHALFEVNLFAPMRMVQEFVHLLIASGDGRVVQSGSICGIMPVPFNAAYNASKAALHSFSNTLRVELAPFNVKVVNVVAGGVQSNISRPNTLPDDSLFKAMEDLYQERRISRSQLHAIPAEEYARVVVSETLKPNPRAWLWTGHNSFLTWFMDTFLGRTAFDWLMNRTFGLNEFAVMVANGKAKTD